MSSPISRSLLGLPPEGDKPIIFLDFDGVINTARYGVAMGTPLAIDPIAVRLIDKVAAAAGALIVVSSVWRLDGTAKTVLESYGVWRISEHWATPRRDDAHRGNEIRDWLRAHRPDGFERFIVIDDDLPEQGTDISISYRWVHVKSGNDGISYDEAHECLKKLGVGDAFLPSVVTFSR